MKPASLMFLAVTLLPARLVVAESWKAFRPS